MSSVQTSHDHHIRAPRRRGRVLVTGMPAAFGALALLVAVNPARAQNYATSINPAGVVAIPGTTDIGNHCDDCVTTITLPFAVSLYGTSYTSAGVNSNGTLNFGSTSSPYSNLCLPTTSFTSPVILPFWDDLITSGAAAGQGVFTATAGAAPNRTFVVEWRGQQFPNTTAAPNQDFEILLYEGQAFFDIAYLATSAAGGSATSGVQQNSATATQYSCNTASLSNGLVVRYSFASEIPGSCCNPNGLCTMVQGSSACSAPSVFFGINTCAATMCPAPVAPDATDLGTLVMNTPVQVSPIPLAQQQVAWFKFAVPTVSGPVYLDIDTFGSTTAADTMIALYNAAGSFIAGNDDFSSLLSALSFGSSTQRPMGFHGQNGSLPAGTYYLALTGFPTSWGALGWNVVSNSTQVGNAALSFRLGGPPLGPSIDPCSFAPRVQFPGTSGGAFFPRIAVADLDGDGKPDIAMVCPGVDQVWLFRNTSSSGTINAGSFAPVVVIQVDAPETGSLGYGIAVGDLDGDGKLDIAVTGGSGDSNGITIFRNSSSPGVLDASSFSTRIAINNNYALQPDRIATNADIAIADIDGDGTPDIVTPNCVLRNQNTPGVISPALFSATWFPAGVGGEFLAIADLDGDGRRDIAVSCHGCSVVRLVRNTSAPGVTSFDPPADVAIGPNTRSLAVADFNGDGRPDILLGGGYPFSDVNISIIQNNTGSPGPLSAGAFSAPIAIASQDGALGLPSAAGERVSAADLNADGRPEIVLADDFLYYADCRSRVSVFQNLCPPGAPITAASFAAPVPFCSGFDGATGIAFADFDGDGKIDMAGAVGGQSGNAEVFRNVIGASVPPVANAGPDQSVPEGSPVILDGSASAGANGGAPQLTWTQVAGPAIVLNLADPARPTFTAPQVDRGGATLTFRLDVANCAGGAVSAFVNVAVTNVNHPPVAEAGPDQTVQEGSAVALDGSMSYDPDGDVLAFAWVQTAGPAVVLNLNDPMRPTFNAPQVDRNGAVLTFALGVSDGLASSASTVNVTVENVNHAPVASAGTGGTFDENTVVTLDATASSDPDADALIYSWQQIGGPGVSLSDPASPIPTFLAPQVGPAGALLSFRVTVGDGLVSASADVSVFIRNVYSPPACSMARPSTTTLWPPNHHLVPVSILGLSGADTGQVTVTVLGVTQDEPINGLGDGDTAPDAVIQGDTVLLRAERAGTGNGRVYRITFQAASPGGTCTGFVTVGVPHDQSHGGVCIDDGQVYSSLGH